jgi:glyoxylase-like metal-dependent hydrolase (beta-lactamase superfamily II)
MENALFHFQLGKFNCLAINDVDGWNCNVLFIDTGQQKVLVETGNGDASSPPGKLVERLQEAGINPDEIDVVILSHADCDHIGGVASKDGILTFQQARIVLSRQEWTFWSSKPERLLRSDQYDEDFRGWANSVTLTRLPHLDSRLTLIDGEAEIVKGIRVIPAFGHTPGMLSITVSSDQKLLRFIADMIYNSEIGSNKAWHAAVDVNPDQAEKTRDLLFEQAAKERTQLMAYHLPFPGLGYVERYGQGWRWQPMDVTKS